MKIEYSPKFTRLYKKLPEEIQFLTENQVKIFRQNPFDLRLKTHKLSGPLRKYWAFWINYRYRIIFSFLNQNTIRFHIVGDHSIYQ